MLGDARARRARPADLRDPDVVEHRQEPARRGARLRRGRFHLQAAGRGRTSTRACAPPSGSARCSANWCGLPRSIRSPACHNRRVFFELRRSSARALPRWRRADRDHVRHRPLQARQRSLRPRRRRPGDRGGRAACGGGRRNGRAAWRRGVRDPDRRPALERRREARRTAARRIAALRFDTDEWPDDARPVPSA